jgi:hypothetical protein
MAIIYPVEYELGPRSVDAGTRWLTLRIKTVGPDVLTALDLRLNSLDAYGIAVYGTGSYVAALVPEEEKELPFQVLASTSAALYVSIDGRKVGKPFHWESPSIPITVGREVAELVSLVALTEPYPPLQKSVKCEATIRGITQDGGLKLEFWANTPSGAFEELAVVETKALGAGEVARYSAGIIVSEVGAYTIYAYLYDGVRRIGRKAEHIYVT